MVAETKRRVLFLCTGNSARSQMAEGWLRHLAVDYFEVYSAGVNPKPHVHPMAVQAMAEVGVDIAGHYPKDVQQFVGQLLDLIITVCDRAKESCPTFPGDVQQLHWSLDAPAAATGSDQYRVFQRVRNEIQQRVRRFVSAQVKARV